MLKIPAIRILSREIELLGQVDTFSSLSFKRQWQGIGEFQLVLSGAAKDAEKLKVGRIITLDADGHRAGIIQSIKAKEADNITYTVAGSTLNGLTARRITLPDNDAYNGGYDNVPALTSTVKTPSPVPAETIFKTYAARHLTSPTDAKRKLEGLFLAPDLGRGTPSVWMSRLEPLSDVLCAVGEFTDMGYEIYVDFAAKRLIFEVITGVDRTYSQSKNSRVLLRSDLDNISNVSYNYNLSALKNLGYAGGKGEDEKRVILKVTNDETEPTGWERRETFLDCGALEIAETATTMSLSEEGKHQLKDFLLDENLSAAVISRRGFEYMKNWTLGDKVTIISKKLGVALDTRITEVTEKYEGRELGIDVTLGQPSPDLGRLIRKFR